MGLETKKPPVIIVGGGIVGLSAALLLLHHGVESILIERHTGPSIHPRARSVNARTMEIFRHLRLDDAVREAGAAIFLSKGIYSGPSLREVIEAKPRTSTARDFPFSSLFSEISPVQGTFVTQDLSEPILADAARNRGCELKFNTECLNVEQDSDCVRAMVKNRDSGAVSEIRANYIIAADGAKSPIRNKLKVPTSGQGIMGHLLNVLFHADLKALVHQREFSLCVVERPEVCGLFASIDNDKRWVFQLSYDPSKGEKASDYSVEKCIKLLRAALGIAEIDIEIKSILPWEPAVQVAERLRHGRIFLAGDAAHQMPPWGGQGGNSGIADAHNLAWKLAAVLKGQATGSLLDTYDEERLPAVREAAEASAAGADEKGLISVKKNLTVIRGILKKVPLISGHGYQYTSQGICSENTFPLGGITWKPWTIPSVFLSLDGRPGSRIPHLWIKHQGRRISTLDLGGKSFLLLTGASGGAWLRAAREISCTLSVSIAAYSVGPDRDIVSEENKLEIAMGISSSGVILVRPDDFVVFRERRQPSNPQKTLEQAIKQALCL